MSFERFTVFVCLKVINPPIKIFDQQPTNILKHDNMTHFFSQLFVVFGWVLLALWKNRNRNPTADKVIRQNQSHHFLIYFYRILLFKLIKNLYSSSKYHSLHQCSENVLVVCVCHQSSTIGFTSGLIKYWLYVVGFIEE